MGKDEVDIGQDVRVIGGQPLELWGFGIQLHPDGMGPLHVGQATPRVPVAAVNYVASETMDAGIPGMLAAASAVSATLRAWMDEVASDPRCLALGGLQAVETRMKVRHLYGL